MGKKKQLKRQFKKGLKFLRKTIGSANPRLAGAFAGGSGVLVAAALDPKVQESARALAFAIGEFVKRATMGESQAESQQTDDEADESAYEHH